MFVVTVNKDCDVAGKEEFVLAIWPNESWRTAFYPTYEMAFEYVLNYLGKDYNYCLTVEGRKACGIKPFEVPSLLNTPYQYNGYGDKIQIEQL